jgi:hypothetical protein
MTKIIFILAAALVIALPSIASATCGTKGGPGYRGPDGRCVSTTSGQPPYTFDANPKVGQPLPSRPEGVGKPGADAYNNTAKPPPGYERDPDNPYRFQQISRSAPPNNVRSLPPGQGHQPDGSVAPSASYVSPPAAASMALPADTDDDPSNASAARATTDRADDCPLAMAFRT